VGIPSYGYSFSGATQPRVPSATFDRRPLAYNQIVSNSTLWNNGQKKRWDDVHKADYLSVLSTNQFVTYNDTRSIHEIVSWGQDRGFGGYMLYILHEEYLPAAAGDARYPLSTALYNEVRGASAPPAIISDSALPPGTVGTGYSRTLTHGGSTPIAWRVTAGALPAGLSLDASTGVLRGTPTASGLFTFTVQASNIGGAQAKPFSLAVLPVVLPMGVSPLSLNFTAPVGSGPPKSQTLTVNAAEFLLDLSATASTKAGGGWLRVEASSAVTPATLTVSADLSGLAIGVYNGSITVAVHSVSNSPRPFRSPSRSPD
jgi:hypothetical protein